MFNQGSSNVDLGDLLTCKACGHVHWASREWMKAVIHELRRTHCLSDEVNSFIRRTGDTCFPIPLLSSFACGVCGASGSGNWLVHAHRVPTPAEEREQAKYARLCRACNGFNGLHEYCHRCGGTGYEPTEP